MLKDRSDEFYGARLVADARLHLGAIVNNESSEAFFVTMCKIIKNEFYLGYKTFTGKEIKLSGMKDFIFNSNYGLGIKRETMPTFLANCAKAAVKDKTQAQCAKRFVKWLGEQHDNTIYRTSILNTEESTLTSMQNTKQTSRRNGEE